MDKLKNANQEMESIIVGLKERVAIAENENEKLQKAIEDVTKKNDNPSTLSEQSTSDVNDANDANESLTEPSTNVANESPAEQPSNNQIEVSDSQPIETTQHSQINEAPLKISESSGELPQENCVATIASDQEDQDPDQRIDSQIGNNALLEALRDTSEESLSIL